MSIRKNILIPMIALTVVCSAAVLVSSILLYNRELNYAMNDDIHVAAMTVQNEIDHAKESSHRAAAAIAKNNDIIEAVKSNDRNRILASVNKMLDVTDMEFCTILDNKGTVLVRTHMTEQYGDDVTWQGSIVSALSGETVTVVDRGTGVLLSTRTAAPIFDEGGNLLGAISLGNRLDTSDFVQNLKRITGCEITIFSGNERIATTIRDEHGEYAVGTKAEDDVSNKVLAGESYIGRADVLSREMITEYTPLYSANDEVVGMMFVGKYTENDKNKLLYFIERGILITLIVLAATAIIAIYISNSIDRRIDDMMFIIQDSEEKVKASEKRLQTLFDAAPIGINLWNKDAQNFYVNEAAVNFLGLSSKEEYYEKFFDISPEYQPDGRLSSEKGPEFLQKAFTEGHCRYEWVHQKLDGELVPCEITMIRIDYEDISVVAGYTYDLRAIRAAEAELLRFTEEKTALGNLEKILNGLNVIICVTDPDTNEILFANDHMKKRFNIEGECTGKKCYKTFRGNDQRCERCPCDILNKDTQRVFIWEDHHPVTKRIYQSFSRYIDWPGDRKVHLEHSIDITELKETAYTLDRRLEQQSLMTRISQSFFSGGDIDTMLTKALQDVGEFMGISQVLLYKVADDELTLFCQSGWLDPKHNLQSRVGGSIVISDALRDIFKSLNDQNKFYVTYDTLGVREIMAPYRKNFQNYLTTSIFIEGKLYALLDFSRAEQVSWSENEIQMASFTSNILTGVLQKYEMEESLIRARESAEQSSRYKSTFLANMSHEIRTPMNAILGITEIQLRDETLSADMQEGLEKVYDSGNLLLNIINDILDFSKIEAGKLEIIPAKYDIPSLINDTVQINRFRYDSKPIEFYLDIDENTPLNMFGDELRLKQILGNILSNAFKYTDKGEVRLSVSIEQGHEDNVILIFRVSDTGQGMTTEQINTLFDEYTRFNMEANRTTVGTGLGMSITKHLVELMDGKITVTSEVNKGSLFIVRIPQKRINGLVCGKETAEKLRKFSFQSSSMTKKNRMLREYMPYGNVLVVDDGETNIYVTRGMLLPYGLQVDTASSGFEAIEKVRRGNVYDIIFMDHMMPKMDGMEAAKIIRDSGYNNPIVALTANALVGQAEFFLENGFDGYISKPIDSRELNQILNEFIRNKKPPEVVKAARREQREKSGTANNQAPLRNTVSEVIKFFVLDAESAIEVLEGIYAKLNEAGEEEFNSFEITVHGMKSALGNIGEAELSADALRLEKAAMDRDITSITEETPAFIDALKGLVNKHSQRSRDGGTENKVSDITDEESAYLKDKLEEIKTACQAFETNTVRSILEDLRQKKWPQDVDDILDEINVHLLHSSFKKAISAIENFSDMY